MRYLKAAVLPASVAVVAFVVLIWLEALALRQYFEDGFGRTVGEAVWSGHASYFVLLATLSIAALWTGYRAARSGRLWVAALVSGPLVVLLLAGFWLLVVVIVQGISGMQAVLEEPGLAQAGFVVSALVAGAIGAWASNRGGFGTSRAHEPDGSACHGPCVRTTRASPLRRLRTAFGGSGLRRFGGVGSGR